MKVAKIKTKVNNKKIEEQESYSLKNMIKIVIILLVIFGIFYTITLFLVKDKKTPNNESNAVVDLSKITLSQLLNRTEQEYYVIATKSSLYESSYIETNYIELYNNHINKYKQNETSLPFYYIDLDNALNKKYLDDSSNITEELSKLKLSDEVLFKIKDGKIEKYYIGREKILDKLSRL